MKTNNQKPRQTTLCNRITYLWSKGKQIVVKLWQRTKPGFSFNNILSIAALIIAIWSFSRANTQFKVNSEQSESLFNIQMEKAEKQLEIINQQLVVSKQIQKDQIAADAPFIVYNEMTYYGNAVDTSKQIYPIITTSIQNTGGRPAANVVFRGFVISKKPLQFRSNSVVEPPPITLGPNEKMIYDQKVKFSKPFNDLYYCTQVSFLDTLTGKKYVESKYHKLTGEPGKYTWSSCYKQDIDYLKGIIKEIHKVANIPFTGW